MIEFINVEGQEYPNLPLSQFIQAVSAGNQAEWEGYSGQAGIYWRNEHGDRRIIFTPGGVDSYLLQYYDDGDGLDYYFVSCCKGSPTDIVEVSVGGDAWLVPANLFIPKSDAIQVLSYFHTTHERSDAISWVRNNEVNWPEE